MDEQSDGVLNELTSLLGASVGGGKMLRGGLVKLGYELAGGASDSRIFSAAAAYELLHTGLLVHDDIMDHSRLRRGRPAVYVAAGAGHYGLSQALCLADAAFFMAHHQLAAASFESERTAPALARFSQIAMDTAVGQMLDVALSRPGAERTEADVMRIHELKTAAYTITGPLAVGSMLGGAEPEQLAAIERYGRLVGTAFQIQDDVLGVFADEKVTGKPAASDIAENKNTLLIAYAAAHASPKQQAVLGRLYGRADLTAAELERIKQIFIDSGALEYSQAQAQQAAAAGAAAAAGVTADEGGRQLLIELAEYTVSRAF
ncbi:MAG: polyprenyl synthetase family protein [Candidatus Saccharimonadales bacterium]